LRSSRTLTTENPRSPTACRSDGSLAMREMQEQVLDSMDLSESVASPSKRMPSACCIRRKTADLPAQPDRYPRPR
jgi:hypothetical protein